MGTTTVSVRLTNVADPDRHADVEMIVDSGAIYSVVPAPTLRGIGIEPRSREIFALADGRRIRRDVGHAVFEIDGRRGPSTVVFGRRGDASLLGMVALEEMGLSLDPLKRRLRPLRLMIA
jgi:predicted aspartyl protease